jgi:hypothetical protein
LAKNQKKVIQMAENLDKKGLENEEDESNTKALDEDDIAVLSTYVR